jgi:hypothetical protein
MTPATLITHDGIKQSVIDWALDYGVTPGIIIARLERGMAIGDAITKPMQLGFQGQRLASPDMEKFIKKTVERKPRKSGQQGKRYTHDDMSLTIPEWAKHTGLSEPMIRQRLAKGWNISKAVSTPFERRRLGVTTPGVVSNFQAFQGTGAGSTVQESRNITFSGNEA